MQPGDTLGIIGGGQLGRMLAMAAARLGFRTIVIDPQENAPAFQVANDIILADYEDGAALDQLAQACDAVTYEFENVPVNSVEHIIDQVPCHPTPSALSISQDRLIEKNFFNNLGIKTADFKNISEINELKESLSVFKNQGILKTRRFGYDGKGQIRLNGADPQRMKEAEALIEKQPCILESMVPFAREVSIIAARDEAGTIAAYDMAENVHRDGILHTSTVPTQISDAARNRGKEIAKTVLSALGYVGVIGIEFFVMENEELLVNEFAPRVHNSGHWTEAACIVSQFEQHIRAVTGLPLGEPARHSNCIMTNLIGEEIYASKTILADKDVLLHLYGKREARRCRKMGHFTKISEIIT